MLHSQRPKSSFLLAELRAAPAADAERGMGFAGVYSRRILAQGIGEEAVSAAGLALQGGVALS
jgi:hypothetical protein